MEQKLVQIRFNTNFPERSEKKWRLLVDGQETLVDHILIGCECYTTQDYIVGVGMKYHITAKPKVVEIGESNDGSLIAKLV